MPDEQVKQFEFRNFIFNISAKQEERYKSALTAIGYLLHTYKNPSYYKFVLLMDEMAQVGGKRKGRTGKGILESALAYCYNTDTCQNILLHQDGSNFKDDYAFSIQGISSENKACEA